MRGRGAQATRVEGSSNTWHVSYSDAETFIEGQLDAAAGTMAGVVKQVSSNPGPCGGLFRRTCFGVCSARAVRLGNRRRETHGPGWLTRQARLEHMYPEQALEVLEQPVPPAPHRTPRR
jgi:hypothetical protein